MPEPRATELFSGNLRLRLPKSLHAEAVRAAAIEEVSLNTLIVAALSKGVGRREGVA